MTKEFLMTNEGYQKIETELEHLKIVKRKEVSEKIKEALAFGDISENSEYDEAKNEQAEVEKRIIKLDHMLRNAKIVDESQIDTTKVTVGCHVKLNDIEFDEILDYHIVGSTEADPFEMKISNESPLGLALLNKEAGTIIEVDAPDGVVKYEILEIHL